MAGVHVPKEWQSGVSVGSSSPGPLDPGLGGKQISQIGVRDQNTWQIFKALVIKLCFKNDADMRKMPIWDTDKDGYLWTELFQMLGLKSLDSLQNTTWQLNGWALEIRTTRLEFGGWRDF